MWGEKLQRTPNKNLIKISSFLDGVFGVMTCFQIYGNTMIMGIEQTMYMNILDGNAISLQNVWQHFGQAI